LGFAYEDLTDHDQIHSHYFSKAFSTQTRQRFNRKKTRKKNQPGFVESVYFTE